MNGDLITNQTEHRQLKWDTWTIYSGNFFDELYIVHSLAVQVENDIKEIKKKHLIAKWICVTDDLCVQSVFLLKGHLHIATADSIPACRTAIISKL